MGSSSACAQFAAFDSSAATPVPSSRMEPPPAPGEVDGASNCGARASERWPSPVSGERLLPPVGSLSAELWAAPNLLETPSKVNDVGDRGLAIPAEGGQLIVFQHN